MKKPNIISITFILFLISISCPIFAQDTIFYKNASNIVVIVKEVSQTEVQYKKMELPDGPMYIVSKNDIEKIVYKNGYTEIIKAAAVEPPSQPFSVTYGAPVSVGKQTISYDDTKSRFSRLITIIDRHPDASVRPALMDSYRSMRHLKAGQDATRTVAIVFGGITIAAGALTALFYAVDTYAGESLAPYPIAFGTVALVSTAAAVTFNINLKKKRHAFVNLYNQ